MIKHELESLNCKTLEKMEAEIRNGEWICRSLTISDLFQLVREIEIRKIALN